jgi:hypothetical protein
MPISCALAADMLAITGKPELAGAGLDRGQGHALMAGTKVSWVNTPGRRTNELRTSQVPRFRTKYPNRTIGG